MQRITPHLWFDKEAKEATAWYVSLFPNSKVTSVKTITDTPSGDCDIVSFELAGLGFQAISAGPVFKFTPAISLFVCCDTKEEVDKLWGELSQGGQVMMDLGSYPFSERYGWLNDKHGLSWQIMYMNGQAYQQKIIPALLFVGEAYGKTEEAMNFYTSIFKDAKVNYVMKYGPGEGPDKEGNIKHAGFILDGLQFSAMENAHDHKFGFNEAISFIVNCESQDEVDYYWEKLSAVPAAEQCGWVKDKFGLSWQIIPTQMGKLLNDANAAKAQAVTQAMLQMKKIDIAKLQQVYDEA